MYAVSFDRLLQRFLFMPVHVVLPFLPVLVRSLVDSAGLERISARSPLVFAAGSPWFLWPAAWR